MAIISFAVSVYVMHINKSAAFYLAPTRAWELLVGAIIALNAIHSIKNNFLRNGFSVFGLGMIGYSIFFYTEKTLFPGSAALLPVLGAGLIIYSGQCGGTGIGRFLSLRPLVFTGLISYSLYLWHWPLLVFSKYFLMRELIPPETAGVIILTFIFSFFSWKFIEQPFRSKPPLLVHRSGLFAVSGLVMAVAVIAGVLVFKKDGLPKRFLGNPMIYAMEYDPFWKPESWSQGNLVTDNVKAIRLGTPQEFLILLRNIKTLGYGIHCWRERPVAFWWH